MKLKWGFREAWYVSLALKVLLAILIPLSLDESYYWVWGQHPQLSYFDHPPMIGWLFFIGRAFEFIGGSASRIPGVILGHCTLLVWNEILRPYFDSRSRALWLLLVVASPLIGWGSIVQTPDVPFVFFWSLSILCFLRALETQRLDWYALLGMSLGLGFCSKYPIVLFVPTIFLYLLIEKKFSQVRWSYVLQTVIIGLIFCFPVLSWNYHHEWASFLFQLNHGLGAEKKSLFWPVKYLLEQFVFLFPVVVIYFYKTRLPQNLRSLYYFALFPIAFFFLSSFKARVEPNWPIAAYPAFMTIAFVTLVRSPWYKRTVAIWLCVFAVVLAEVFHPFLPVDPAKLKTNEFVKFDAALPYAKDAEPLYANSYQLASALSYKLKRDIPKLQGMNRKDFYDFFPPARATSDKFFIVMDGDDNLPSWAQDEGYEKVNTTKISDRLSIVEVRKRAKASDS